MARRRPVMTPEEATDLLDALADPGFLEIECEICGRPISAHSSEEVSVCEKALIARGAR